MSLHDVTRAIIAEVERVSGYPVFVTEDRSLRTLAAVLMARGNAPAHTIAYDPAASTQPDYLIAYQSGFILRLFTNPPSERWGFAPAAHGREIVHRLLSGPEGPARKLHLQPQALEKLRDQLIDGLMVQLRSILSVCALTGGFFGTSRGSKCHASSTTLSRISYRPCRRRCGFPTAPTSASGTSICAAGNSSNELGSASK